MLVSQKKATSSSKKSQASLGLWVAALSLLSVASASADRQWLVADSTYLGDGNFQYHIGFRWNPLFYGTTFYEASVSTTNWAGVTNWVDAGTVAPGWHSVSNGQWENDEYMPYSTGSYDAVFQIQSSLTNYQQGMIFISLGADQFFGSWANGKFFTTLESLWGYWYGPALIPCLPEEQQPIPASLSTNLSYPDMSIKELLRGSNGIYGIVFSNFDCVSTCLLEASSDLSTWRKVAYLYGTNGLSTWTTTNDLGRWGNFFRLDYIGYGFLDFSALPPLDPTPAKLLALPPNCVKPAVSVNQTILRVGDKLRLHLDALPGQTYQVQVSQDGKTVWSTQSTATSTNTTVDLPMKQLPASGLIHATILGN
jgi:hypothetical protein